MTQNRYAIGETLLKKHILGRSKSVEGRNPFEKILVQVNWEGKVRVGAKQSRVERILVTKVSGNYFSYSFSAFGYEGAIKWHLSQTSPLLLKQSNLLFSHFLVVALWSYYDCTYQLARCAFVRHRSYVSALRR